MAVKQITRHEALEMKQEEEDRDQEGSRSTLQRPRGKLNIAALCLATGGSRSQPSWSLSPC